MAIDLIHGPWPQTPGLSTSPRIARVSAAPNKTDRPRRVAVILRTIPASTYFVEIDAASCRVELFDSACRAYFRARLFEALTRHSARLHAYALLADRAVMLVSSLSRCSLERLAFQVQQAYLSYFNQRFRRRLRGTRGFSALCCVQGSELTRECYRLIERWPLVAGESLRLGDTEWSSYPANAFGHARSGLVRHACFDSLVPDEQGSLALYRDFVSRPLDPIYARYLVEALHKNSLVDERAIPAFLPATNY